MIRRQLRIYVSGLAVLLLCGMIAQAAAGDGGQLLSTEKKKTRAARPSGQFSVAGSFSGELAGAINVGGKMVYLKKGTILRYAGGGKIKPGTHLSKVHVYASGAVKRGVPVASMILVSSNINVGEQIKVRLDSKRNRDKFKIPSEVDPNVGELKKNTPE